MSKKNLGLETEFAYHSSRLKLVEESRVALESIRDNLDLIQEPVELRMVASSLAETSMEEAIKVFDYSLLAGIYQKKYRAAISAIASILLLAITSNLITGTIAFTIGRNW